MFHNHKLMMHRKTRGIKDLVPDESIFSTSFFLAHCFSAMAKDDVFAILVKVAETFPLKMKGRSSLSEK